MTIKEFILAQKKNLGINDWIALIKENGFEKYESSIIQAVDSLNLIMVENEARSPDTILTSFIKAIDI